MQTAFLILFGFIALVVLTGLWTKHFRIVRESYEDEPISKIKKWYSAITIIIGTLLMLVAIWLLNNFGMMDFESYLFTITEPMSGTPSSILVIVGAYLLFGFLFIMYVVCSIFKTHIYSYILKFRNFKLPFFPSHKIKKYGYVFGTILLISSICINYRVFDLRYLFEENSDYIETHYIQPKQDMLTFPSEKRNLVYIFLESFESSMFPKELGGAQTENYTTYMKKLMQEDNVYHFSNTDKVGGAIQAPGTSWSTAGMVAQLSGIPMKVELTTDNYNKYGAFLPGLVNAGDLLHEAGYKQSMTMGINGDFAGVKNYFQTHGDFEVYDSTRMKEMGFVDKDYSMSWEIEDKKLYEFSKQIMMQDSQSGQPFVNVIETIDTHEPGFVDPTCEVVSGDKQKDSFACADKQVYEFVKWIQSQPFYENTTIVIQGDHLARGNHLFDNMDSDYTRTTFNLIINPSPDVVQNANFKNRQFSPMDMFPTTLAAMGIKIDGERLGLGVNLFSNEPTLYEQLGTDTVLKELSKKSSYYFEKFKKEKK